MESIMDAAVQRTRTVNGVPTSIADLGYLDYGLDDAWQEINSGPGGAGYHTKAGDPIVNTVTFPDLGGMVSYAHARNLSCGWYGNNCISKDMSSNISHFQGDVKAFRAFNFDSYKLDSCGGENDIALWYNLLNSSGRAVTIENCHNGPFFPSISYKPNAPTWCPFNFYRTSVDVEVLYASIFAINLQKTVPFLTPDLSFPGCWGYADGLEVGVAPGLHKNEVALTFEESRAHFGAWAIISSPLILELDIRNDTLVDLMWPIISNTEVIAVNQKWAGSPGQRIKIAQTNITYDFCGSQYQTCHLPSWEVYSKPLVGGGAAILILNHDGTGTAINVTVDLNTVPGLNCGSQTTSPCAVRDLWAHAAAGTAQGGQFIATGVPAHDSIFVTLI